MLTRILIKNFKRFGDVDVELGSPVVLVGPNNSGKTTALQAIALWDIGLRRWQEKRAGKQTPEKRPGVTINRRDLIAVPVPGANLLWRDLHVREVERANGKQRTRNVRIDITVEGVSGDKTWRCGLEFDYANEESFYCRPLRLSDEKNSERMPVPQQALERRIAYLPPMSGLAASETRLDPGAINVRLGEGRTADVLRNLCYQLVQLPAGTQLWKSVVLRVEHLFGVTLEAPIYVAERGEITMSYKDESGSRLDLASSGRGLQQTLLLLAHLAVNPNSVLLLDEPDAHLEILRQRQTYQLLSETAREHNSQLIIASHSEVVLNEAAARDVVVAFLGRPHRIDDRGSQVLKSLKDIGFDQYLQAEQKGWVLYLEGPTDLAILQTWARKTDHVARGDLDAPFVHYVENKPKRAREHFFGLREAKADLVGIALFDRLRERPQESNDLIERQWRHREIESYLCSQETLLSWARAETAKEDGRLVWATEWVETMRKCIDEVAKAADTLGRGSPWSPDTKVSDDFLDPLFELFFKTLGLGNQMRKSGYWQLAEYVPTSQIDPEIGEVLDDIARVAGRARPVTRD